VLLEINGEDVSQTALADIPRVLERTKRPMTIKFERVIMSLHFEDVVRDPRKLPWFMQFLVDTYGVDGGVVDQVSCPSIYASIHPCIHLCIHPSIHPSIRNFFQKTIIFPARPCGLL
jgi:hypothetical protein